LREPQLDFIKKWFVRELARSLDINEEAISENEPFSRFGLDSAKAVGLLNRLGEFLGRKVPIPLAWSYPTIERLSNHLCGNPELKSEVSRRHSFCPPARNQPIAVVGLACRFPGAPDPGAFWELLLSGRSAIRGITPDRWNIEAWYDPDPKQPGKMNARAAGLLQSIDKFDPGFFGISPREAIQMDPQQRLALELAWEALECAGIRPSTLRGSRTGLFVGVAWHDYQTLARKAGAEITLHSGTGQAFSIVANRVSHALGLQGPSIALDTACSSSLVSVHLACQSLYSGDANLAIAGGVNLIIDPETTVTLSKFGGLSPTNQLSAFDARANGFVRGEGGGFVVLKPLSRAVADGDPIYAVIRGTAVNNDGASNGLTAPNPLAQETVVREAYLRAGIRTADVHYVEAHGTGTQLGDPIEAQALGNVFASERPGARPLLLGSVKTNIGHLESAAGIAGLIKLILSIKHRQVPPSLNFEIPSPHIDFTRFNLRVVTELEPWPDSATPAIGGVSAFGWGGTNCHIVVEEAVRSHAHLLPLSAPDIRSLKATAETLRTYLSANAGFLALGDVCATAAARCTAQPQRVALTATSLSDLDHQLEGFLLDQKRPGVAVGYGATSKRKLAFTFSPQGSQRLGMGRSLLTVEPVFRAKLAECDRLLTTHAGWSLFDLLLAAPEESWFSQVEFIQPVLTAIQLALAELWISWGVRPDFVAAHSLGEWAAAGVAGALTIDEVMRIAVESSRSQSMVGTGGGMAIVELTYEEVTERIREWPGEIFIAGQNSPTSILLSGDVSRLKSLVTIWKDEGLTCSLIDVNIAAHSPGMDSAADRLQASLSGLHPTRAAIPLVSSVTGGRISGPELGAEHWARHLRRPVLFTEAIEQLANDGCTVFLEIGPHPVLIGGITQVLAALGIDGVPLGSCRRADDERQSLLSSLGALYVVGQPIDWRAVLHGGRDDLDLPVPNASFEIVTCARTAKEINDTSQRRPSVSITSYSSPSLLPLSGHTNSALRDRAQSIAEYLRTHPGTSLDDVLSTLSMGREHLEHRLAAVGARCEQLIPMLEAFAEGKPSAELDLVIGRTRANALPRVAFVCSGQGPQWQGMGRDLMHSIPVFRKEISRCAEEMKRHVSWDLIEELERDEPNSNLAATEIAQRALFALQIALAAVWRSWGVIAQALVGHSAGEIAAAHLSGVLLFEDAVTVICRRGRLMQRATGLGKMAVLELTEAEAKEFLHLYPDRISIAAVNSPTSIVVSGEAIAIDQIVKAAMDRGVRAKLLPVDYAFHSGQMEPFRVEMAESVSGLRRQTPSIPIYSTVTGKQATNEDFDPNYWGRNIRQPVRFAAAVEAMLDAGIDSFVELSPHPVLSSMIAQCAQAINKNAQQLPSLRRGVPDCQQMLRSLGTLFVSGLEVDWQSVYPGRGQVVALPSYPWQRKRYWLDRISVAESAPKPAQPEVPSNWFYKIVWEEKPRTEDAPVCAGPRRLPSPRALETGVQGRLADLQAETRLVHGSQAREDLEKLAAYYSAAALLRLGFESHRLYSFTAELLQEELGVQKSHSRLFRRMLDILVEEGLLTFRGTHFETAPLSQNALPRLLSLAEQVESLRRKHFAFATEFELLARCGAELPNVFRGTIQPLQLLFPVDGTAGAERLYRESTSARFYNRLVGELVSDAVRQTSFAQPARLLELGAGTGSTTTSVLEQLGGVGANYCFTDVSRLMLNEARARFEHFPAIRYALLNIENSPASNGFEPGTFDLVLAANVLHATRNLRATLEHTRQLLAPGGLLVLLETTRRRRWLDLIFGLAEGWSRFADTELRPKSALLGRDQWLTLLKDSGFAGAEAIAGEISANDPHPQTVLLAQTTETASVPSSPQKERSFSAVGSWLIFSDTGQIADPIADWLESHGGECVVVRAGDHFDPSDPSRPSINLDDPEDYRRLFETKKSWRGVLHAWSLDAVLKNGLEDLEKAERFGCQSLLFLVRALVAAKNSEPPKLWILTRGAQPAWKRSGFDSIGQAPVWGFGRTFALEHPEFWGGIIDLDPGSDPDVLAERILLEMCYPDGENQIALSGESRRVPRLVASQPPSTTALTIKADALYLITGGLGGIGPQIAGWLVDRGARHLLLCSRRKLPDRSAWQELAPSDEWYGKIGAIQALERQGASIAVETVDVGDPVQMEALFERLRRFPMPLCGIIHAAADIRLCSLQEMDADALHATMHAKVEGSWLLHKLSAGLPLDFFILFSSTAGLFGASNLGHYAASNQFLDSLAHSRRAQGLPGISINWGAWNEMRFLGRDEIGRFGLKTMPSDLALQAMSFVIADSSAQWIVADVDWDVLGEAFAMWGHSKLFERVRAKREVATENRDWIERLERVEAEDRRNLVATLVAKETRYILGLTTDDRLDPDRGFFELGMDSLMSVQLKARLEQAVGRVLPATLTFTYPTVHNLSDFIANQVLNLPGAAALEAPLRFEGPKAEPEDALADLSEEDIKDLLSAELSSLKTE
jgi:acyl transferase domain-containing protein/acyl carrier protein/SAM-dependent methyltransferase/NAD(P)-dependent dehydrogenase (short-subunit alcohol dehydrogenase family)